MKQKAITVLYLLLTLSLSVQGQPLQVRSEMKEAKVFFQGAQIIREAQVRVPAGINELVFTRLPLEIDPSGIQVKATGQLTILSVNYRHNFLDSPELSREVRTLEDSLKFFRNRIDLNRAMLKVYEEEEAMLAANRSIGGSQTGVRVVDLRAAADFMRQRLQEVKTSWLKVKQEVDRDEERHNRIAQQLGLLRGRVTNQVGEISVMVSAAAPTNSNFSLAFGVANAGWQPIYDIRVADIDRDLELMLKASVFQNTGEDWNNVKLVFSTGNPQRWGLKPELSQWFLGFDQMATIRLRGANTLQKLDDGVQENEDFAIESARVMAQLTTALVERMEGRTTREYVINTPYNLPSGSEMRMVDLERNSLPAQYQYFVVPKISTDAFLVARVPNWQQFDLLPGYANLFFEGTFLGRTFINPVETADTLEVSLGIDQNIVVRRERMKDLTRKSLLGNRTTETIGWTISARNNKRVPITLNIQDQVPVSTHEDIDVTVDEMSGASLDKERGFVNWRFELKPAETQQRILRYTVRYPGNKRIILE